MMLSIQVVLSDFNLEFESDFSLANPQGCGTQGGKATPKSKCTVQSNDREVKI